MLISDWSSDVCSSDLALLHRVAEQNVVDLAAFDTGALDRGLDREGAGRRSEGVVERAARRLGQRGAGGGNDDGVTHDRGPSFWFRLSLRGRSAGWICSHEKLADPFGDQRRLLDRKSTRLNSSH